ncbi:uncharacterized protein LOC106058152 isoform X2 [Biomphalaria glabrata]|uniref:Uncharacterized protein LOC106058152 isoform X2 n=1 Tax=Biomphalaria glabrata TaxID=6526 RepID=A0A9W3AZV5_BIOGL|nr:uncharacterized protein LOC106058152 isoform X2 [Biomphalaria glabrata]
MEIRTEEHRVQTTRRWYQEIRIHREYLTTIPGILKMTEMGLCILIIICVSSAYWSADGWVHFAAVSCLTLVIINFICHLTDIYHFFIFWHFLVFNFLALAVFGVDTYYMFKAWQEHKRQLVGAAVVTEVTTTTTTPTK